MCTHEMVICGLCAQCGQEINESTKNHLDMSLGQFTVKVNKRYIDTLTEKTTRRLHQEKKLALIIDLDHTLLTATDNKLEAEPYCQEATYHFFKEIKTYIRTRPYVREFLKQISSFYELTIYTLGKRHYAEAVVQYLDPDRSLFGDRILTRDDARHTTTLKLSHLFHCDPSTYLILDNDPRVWNYSPNLITISSFYGFRPSSDTDDALCLIRDQLLKVHQQFYQAKTRGLIANVTNLLNHLH